MGGGGSRPEPEPEPIPNDRVFILIGKFIAGKSTLGNLLLGRNQFETIELVRCYSHTQSVLSAEVTLLPGEVLGINRNADNSLKIKIIDQPGMDDANIEPKTHCENLVKCMSDLNVKTFPTFLLVINLDSNRFLDDNCSLISKLSMLLSQASYSLFLHTVVVFTHADEVCDDIRNKDWLKQIVTVKCQQVGWGGLTEILESVNQRCIFVNGTNTEARYRNELLRDLFEISKSTLHIRFHGNNDFTSSHLKHKLGIETDGIVEEELYLLDYQFHPDINLFWKQEMNLNMKEQIERAVQSMVAIGEGVSSMVILISLFTPFSKQMEELIDELPTHYISENDSTPEKLGIQQWWDQVFIVFEVSDHLNGETTVKENLARSPKMKNLAEKARNRWIWIARNTPQSECRYKITEMCLRVRKEIAGKVFIKDTVIKEIKEMMKQMVNNDTRVVKSDPTFQEKMAQGGITYIGSDTTFIAKFGGITLDREISVSSMGLILRNTMLSREDIKRFRETYRDPKAKVSFEEVLHFLANP